MMQTDSYVVSPMIHSFVECARVTISDDDDDASQISEVTFGSRGARNDSIIMMDVYTGRDDIIDFDLTNEITSYERDREMALNLRAFQLEEQTKARRRSFRNRLNLVKSLISRASGSRRRRQSTCLNDDPSSQTFQTAQSENLQTPTSPCHSQELRECEKHPLPALELNILASLSSKNGSAGSLAPSITRRSMRTNNMCEMMRSSVRSHRSLAF